MKKFLITLLLLSFLNTASANGTNSVLPQQSPAATELPKDYTESCTKWWSWTKPICKRFHQIWTEGDKELYLSGYAWHNRYTYSKHKIRSYNEQAWGGGLGKGFYDEKGDWHGLFAFAFLDSHKNIEPAVGYAFLKVAHLTPNLNLGAGYTVLVTQRPDIFGGIPFPGVLPWVSVSYRKASISATYIPGAAGAGNVLYILGKLSFDLF
ncbi:lipid IV(A) palmitoyltransferase PagP [Legionella massiliensis]